MCNFYFFFLNLCLTSASSVFFLGKILEDLSPPVPVDNGRLKKHFRARASSCLFSYLHLVPDPGSCHLAILGAALFLFYFIIFFLLFSFSFSLSILFPFSRISVARELVSPRRGYRNVIFIPISVFFLWWTGFTQMTVNCFQFLSHYLLIFFGLCRKRARLNFYRALYLRNQKRSNLVL